MKSKLEGREPFPTSPFWSVLVIDLDYIIVNTLILAAIAFVAAYR